MVADVDRFTIVRHSKPCRIVANIDLRHDFTETRVKPNQLIRIGGGVPDHLAIMRDGDAVLLPAWLIDAIQVEQRPAARIEHAQAMASGNVQFCAVRAECRAVRIAVLINRAKDRPAGRFGVGRRIDHGDIAAVGADHIQNRLRWMHQEAIGAVTNGDALNAFRRSVCIDRCKGCKVNHNDVVNLRPADIHLRVISIERHVAHAMPNLNLINNFTRCDLNLIHPVGIIIGYIEGCLIV